MGTDLRVLSESFKLNTNMTGFRWFREYVIVLWTEGDSASQGLKDKVAIVS